MKQKNPNQNIIKFLFQIDESIAILEVSFTILDPQPNTTLENLVIIFTDAAGGRLHPATETLLVSTSATRLYRFEIKNERAIWHVNFGQLACPPPPPVTINIRAQSYLIANVMFFDEKTFKKVENQPIVGGIYTIFIDCPDCGVIDSIVLNPCGRILNERRPSMVVDRTTTNGWWFTKNVSIPSADLVSQLNQLGI